MNSEECMCDDLKVMCNLPVTALIIALLLIVSGNVELNKGTMKNVKNVKKNAN